MHKKTIYYFILVVTLAAVCGASVSIYVPRIYGAPDTGGHSGASVTVIVKPHFISSGSGSIPTPTPTPEPTTTPSPTSSATPTPLPSPADTSSNLKVSMLGDITAGPVDNQNGALQNDLNSVAKSGTISLKVVDGTLAKKVDGSRLELITVDPATEVAPLPKETGLVGQVMDFGPDGATFVPPLIMIIHYTDSDIPPGSTEDDLYIGVWEGTKWTALETTTDKTANVLTASISHFTDHALLMDLHPVPAIPTPTVTPTPITPTPTPPMATASFNWAWVAWIIGALIVILLILFIVNKKNPKKPTP